MEHWQKAKFKLQLTCFHESKIYDYSPTERRIVDMWNAKIMRGAVAQVMKNPIAWQECIHADEPLILSLGHWPKPSVTRTELIADAYGLPDKYSWVDFTVA